MNSKQILETVVKAADSKRAEDIIALDVEGISLLADYFVIMNGNSDRQVQAIVKEITDQAREAGITVKNVEGTKGSRWVLVDLGDVVAHVFLKEEREFYNLEKLWSNASAIDLSDMVEA